MKKFVVLLLLSLFTVAVNAQKVLGNGEFTKEQINKIKTNAENGDAQAQFSLGVLYDEIEDYTNAMAWLMKAADQGHGAAMFLIGTYYRDGVGVAKNNQKALGWYAMAVKANDPNAMYNLGVIFMKGEIVEKNEKVGAQLIEMAAKLGNGKAQNNLGAYYMLGRGVPKDMKKAKYWFEKAAAQGIETAKTALEQYFK